MANRYISVLFSLTLLATLSQELLATHGYTAQGYGVKSYGMGGVAVAYPQDALIATNNPAGMVWTGNNLTVGARIFSPIRRYSYTGSDMVPFSDDVKSGKNWFLIPNFGVNKMIAPRTSLGFVAFANGGLNTSWPRNNPVFGTGKLGSDYIQLCFLPTISHKVKTNHSIGLSFVIATTRLKLDGLQNLQAASRFPESFRLNSPAWGGGVGAHLGWLGKFYKDRISVGIGYATKIHISRLKKIRGIVAEHGKFDIPSTLNAGLCIELKKDMHVAFDYQVVFYNHVPALGNDITNFIPLGGKGLLGDDNGPGFGWRHVHIFKLGMDCKPKDWLTCRMGYSVNSNPPFNQDNMDFNILATAVTLHHFSAGLTFHIHKDHELDIAYMHAFDRSYSGTSKFGLGCITMKMYQNALQVGYTVRF